MVITTSTTSVLGGAPIMTTAVTSSSGVGPEQNVATSLPAWPVSSPAWPAISSVVTTTVTTSLTYTAPATMSLGAKPRDVRVGWIYDLDKLELIRTMKQYGLETGGRSADLRQRFSAFWKKQARLDVEETPWLGGVKSPVFPLPATTAVDLPDPPKTVPQVLVTPAQDRVDVVGHRKELEEVKEMLGLPRAADSQTLRDALAAMVLQTRSTPCSEADPEELLKPSSFGYQGRPRDSQRPHYYERPLRPDTLEVPRGLEMAKGEARRTQPADFSKVCNMVRKWGLKFDGKRDPVSFLERCEELMASYSLGPEDFLRALPELLQGSALLWYRNCKDLLYSFEAFRRQFEIQFLPPGYWRNLDEEIRKRTQGENESFRDFVVAIMTLIRRHGTLSEQGKLDLIYNNMRPEYKLMVRRRDFCSLAEMMERAEDYEAYLREKATFRPPPSANIALVPETAYTHRRKGERQLETAAVDRRPQEPRKRSPTDKPRTPVTGSGYRVGSNVNRPRVERPVVTGGTPISSKGSPRCFRCGEKGHYAKGCGRPRVITCFGCGKPGVTVRQCNCKAGNGTPAQTSGGQLSMRARDERPPQSGQSGSAK